MDELVFGEIDVHQENPAVLAVVHSHPPQFWSTLYGMVGPYLKELRRSVGHGLIMVPSVAALIHDDDGRLLLQKKAGSEGWSLPAGAIEVGESPEEALQREVFEETGSRITKCKLTAAFGGNNFRYKYPNGDQVEYTVLLYQCRVSAPENAPTDAETVELAYFAEHEMPQLALPYPAASLFPQEKI